ncbi:LysM domain-containing GPI-anchored protein 2 [Bienertia sinuspersici]
MDVTQFLLLISLTFFFAVGSITTQPLDTDSLSSSFKCLANNATCEALAGYVPLNTTTLAHIQSLFQLKDLNSLLGVNFFPPSTPENYTIEANQTVKVPFPCRCINGTGLSDKVPSRTIVAGDTFYKVGNYVFSGLVTRNGSISGLVTWQQIAAANPTLDIYNLTIGHKFRIPLPCSCDEVEGQKVVHYAHVMAPGSTLEQVAAEFETRSDTLTRVNNITNPSRIQAGQVIDIPLKGHGKINEVPNSASHKYEVLQPCIKSP